MCHGQEGGRVIAPAHAAMAYLRQKKTRAQPSRLHNEERRI